MKISDEISKHSMAHPILKIKGDGVKNGCYLIPYNNYNIFVIASSGGGWDHVSVTLQGLGNKKMNRTPNWDEMCYIKDMFFAENETVVQFHPPKDCYVNNHPGCLHLWRNQKNGHELPPTIMTGLK